MSFRIHLPAIATFAALLMLSGCADVGEGWNGAISSIGLSPQRQSAVAPASAEEAAAAEAPGSSAAESWCLQVATQERNTAARHGFDAATQQRRFEVSYNQCAALAATPTQ